jgi:hypothetical protein
MDLYCWTEIQGRWEDVPGEAVRCREEKGEERGCRRARLVSTSRQFSYRSFEIVHLLILLALSLYLLSDHPLLHPTLISTHSWSFISPSQPSTDLLSSSTGLAVTIKASSALPRVPATLLARGKEGEFDIRLDPVKDASPQLGSPRSRRGNVMTPGQTIVAWIGDWCIGGGIIAEREMT